MLRGENERGVTNEEEEIIRLAAGSIYAGTRSTNSFVMYGQLLNCSAGSDTTASGIRSFFLYMVLNPGVQRRAQAEIDEVTGGDRPPTYDDRPNLPYVEGLVKEIHRFFPMVPSGDSCASAMIPIADAAYRLSALRNRR
jgi:cytochrome P450